MSNKTNLLFGVCALSLVAVFTSDAKANELCSFNGEVALCDRLPNGEPVVLMRGIVSQEICFRDMLCIQDFEGKDYAISDDGLVFAVNAHGGLVFQNQEFPDWKGIDDWRKRHPHSQYRPDEYWWNKANQDNSLKGGGKTLPNKPKNKPKDKPHDPCDGKKHRVKTWGGQVCY